MKGSVDFLGRRVGLSKIYGDGMDHGGNDGKMGVIHLNFMT